MLHVFRFCIEPFVTSFAGVHVQTRVLWQVVLQGLSRFQDFWTVHTSKCWRDIIRIWWFVCFNGVGFVLFNGMGLVRFHGVGFVRFNGVGFVCLKGVRSVCLEGVRSARFNAGRSVRFNGVGFVCFDGVDSYVSWNIARPIFNAGRSVRFNGVGFVCFDGVDSYVSWNIARPISNIRRTLRNRMLLAMLDQFCFRTELVITYGAVERLLDHLFRLPWPIFYALQSFCRSESFFSWVPYLSAAHHHMTKTLSKNLMFHITSSAT